MVDPKVNNEFHAWSPSVKPVQTLISKASTTCHQFVIHKDLEISIPVFTSHAISRRVANGEFVIVVGDAQLHPIKGVVFVCLGPHTANNSSMPLQKPKCFVAIVVRLQVETESVLALWTRSGLDRFHRWHWRHFYS